MMPSAEALELFKTGIRELLTNAPSDPEVRKVYEDELNDVGILNGAFDGGKPTASDFLRDIPWRIEDSLDLVVWSDELTEAWENIARLYERVRTEVESTSPDPKDVASMLRREFDARAKRVQILDPNAAAVYRSASRYSEIVYDLSGITIRTMLDEFTKWAKSMARKDKSSKWRAPAWENVIDRLNEQAGK